MQGFAAQHWHHLPAREVQRILESDPNEGLSPAEVKRRQERFGPNVISSKQRQSQLARFLQQFHNPLIYILLASSAVTFWLHDYVDAAIIFAVVLVNAIIGYLQESKAEKAIAALAQTMVTEATAIRDGKTMRLPAAELVPGDVVLLEAGCRVPADMRVFHSRDLQIAEAALTGESAPVQKEAECSLPVETIVADRKNLAYASTLVTYGRGKGSVVATGNHTEVGRISDLITTADELLTPLTRKMAEFSHVLLYAILGLAGLTFAVGIWRGQPIIETFMAAIALAVAAIPEGLPAAVTVVLAIGVSRMARRRAIIRKLPAVEALGSTTVICSDKTGTLTQNQMTVQQITSGGEFYKTTNVGYAPAGEILFEDQPLTAPPLPLLECLRAGLLCNDSQLVEKNGDWEVEGDPTEGALIVSALKGGLDPIAQRSRLPRLDAIPFDSQHQYMATLHDTGADRPRLVYLKGSLEQLLAKCASALDANGEAVSLDREGVNETVETMTREGLRVLALARTELPTGTTHLQRQDVGGGLQFLGLQGMSDQPRPEAVTAVRACQTAGIQVKMITGDHALTATAIARQIGLNGTAHPESMVLTGQTMATMSDQELAERAVHTAVFARVTPEQKLRLVKALQSRGHVVAMTGDGVNDAPALKQADIGVAMGKAGTDVAKEAADVVLTNDNFDSIEAAVEEGRGVFENLTKIIAWALPTNVGLGLIILAAVFAGLALPILPVQILWINLTTVGILGVVLAAELKEADIMRRPPRDPQSPILTGILLWRILIVGALILLGAFGLYGWQQMTGTGLAQARTVAVNAVVIIQIFYLFNCRSLTQSMFRIGVFSNRWLIFGSAGIMLLQLLFTYAPPMNRLMSSAPIGLAAWGAILAAGVFSYGVIEFEKWLRRRRMVAEATSLPRAPESVPSPPAAQWKSSRSRTTRAKPAKLHEVDAT